MTKDQVVQACLKMQVNECKDFMLDKEPEKYWVTILIGNLGKLRPDVAYSVNRSGKKLSVQCYIPFEQSDS